jgi:FRG domain.
VFRQRIAEAQNSTKRDKERFAYFQYLRDLQHRNRLLKREIRNEYLPILDVLFVIGAHKLFEEELIRLSEWNNSYIYKMYQTFIGFSHNDFQAMHHWLKTIEKSHPKLSSPELLRSYINMANSFHNQKRYEDERKYLELIEMMVFEKQQYVVEGLEDLMLFYEQTENTKGIKRLSDLIQMMTFTSWSKYLEYTDVIYFHHRRNYMIEENQKLVQQILEKSKEFNLLEEDQRYLEIHTLRLYFENKIAWEEYSVCLYKNRQRYLGYNAKVAVAFMDVFLAINRQAFEIYNRVLDDKMTIEIMIDISTAMQSYQPEIDQQLQSLQDEFLYVKRDLLMRNVSLTQLRSSLEGFSITEQTRERSRLFDNIIHLCLQNGNDRELLHFLVVYADDLQAQDKAIDEMASLPEEQNMAEEMQLSREYHAEQRKLLITQIDDKAAEFHYNSSIAYYLLYEAYFYDYMGEHKKAAFYLHKFCDTHVDFRNYAIAIQDIYRTLETKYHPQPLSPDAQLHQQTINITNLQKAKESKESVILCNDILQELDLHPPLLPQGIRLETLLPYLKLHTQVTLNGHLLTEACQSAQLFLLYGQGYQIPIELNCNCRLFYVEALMRKGNLSEAKTLLKESLRLPHLPSLFRLRFLIKQGYIETTEERTTFKINSLCESLALAEELHDIECIVGIYNLMAHMFSQAFPALSISLLRKSETICSLENISAKQGRGMERAQACFFIHYFHHARYQEKTLPFLEEARKIMENIHRVELADDAARHFYDRITGLVFWETGPLWQSLKFFRRIGARNESYQLAEMIYIIAASKNNKEEALRAANIYFKQAQTDNDVTRLQNINQIIQGIQTGAKPNFASQHTDTGKITLLHILDALSFDEELWALDCSPIRDLFPYPVHEGMCTTMRRPDDSVELCPVCLIPFQYYRGQIHRPCKPSLYRDNMTPAKQFLERLKYEEFRLLIDKHPITDKFVNGFTCQFPDGEKPLHFNIYHQALAQHYGIATSLIDVTSDKWIAAFFACTKCENNIYSPIGDTNEKGIFYIYKDIQCTSNLEPAIRPVGIQPFSRPGEQQGYVVPLLPGVDFENSCQEAIEFEHDPRISELIFNFTNRSRKLFPYDVLEQKNKEITGSTTFSEAALIQVKQDFYAEAPQETIDQYITELNLEFRPVPITRFTLDEMTAFHKEYPKFEQRMKRKVLIMPMLDLPPESQTQR